MQLRPKMTSPLNQTVSSVFSPCAQWLRVRQGVSSRSHPQPVLPLGRPTTCSSFPLLTLSQGFLASASPRLLGAHQLIKGIQSAYLKTLPIRTTSSNWKQTTTTITNHSPSLFINTAARRRIVCVAISASSHSQCPVGVCRPPSFLEINHVHSPLTGILHALR